MKSNKQLVSFLLVGAGVGMFAQHCCAGIANPLIAPPSIIKAETSSATPASSSGTPGGMPVGGQVPAIVPGTSIPNPPPGQYNVAAVGQQALDLPADKWLAHAIVTSTVGDRASILVPFTMNEAQAANTNQGVPLNGLNGGQYGNYVQGAQIGNRAGVALGQSPQFQGPVTAGQPTNAVSNQPQTAVQQLRQEVLYVRNGVPFFFKGERFSVEVSGREVMIWRPSKLQSARDVVFVGSVSSTEMSRRAVIGAYAPSDPAVLKRITPTYGGASNSTGATQQAGPGANPGDPNTGGLR